MRIKRIKLRKYITYPVVINPFFLLVLFVVLPIAILFTGWWQTRRDENYTVYKFKSPREEIGMFGCWFFGMFFNLYFWNKRTANYFSIWFVYKFLYMEFDNSYHIPLTDPKDYPTDVTGNTRRERVLNLYWRIYQNQITIWNPKSRLYKY